jgi:hypothetical protein
MSLCAACGLQLWDGEVVCRHHLAGTEEGWAATNRLMCDFAHHGKVPARARDDEAEDISATLTLAA